MVAAQGSGGVRTVPADVSYLLIDGGYFRAASVGTLARFFINGEASLEDFTFSALCGYFKSKRAFYYDCPTDSAATSQPDQLTPDILQTIRMTQGSHVRSGVLVGAGSKKRQKEVDIHLAVDMLTHSFYKNMTRAVLLAGDRDSRPLVDALVRLGTYVVVACEPHSASDELLSAADEVTELRLSPVGISS